MKPLFYPPPPPPPVPKGKISGQVLNWNNKTQTWQITGDNSLAFGNNAGEENQGTGAIAIGFNAGQFDQGENSIAIGKLAGPTGQGPNSIVLNASGSGVTGGTSGFFVSPIRNTIQTTALGYDTTTNEITYYNTSGNVGSFTSLTSSDDTYLATTAGTKLGVGTTDPNATLDVSGNAIISGPLNVTNTITGDTGSFTNLSSSNNTYLATTANTKLGVGKTTASATATLDVSGNAEISGTLAVGGTIIRGSNATNGTSGFFINPIRNITQTTSLGYDTATNEITYFNAQYASDSWLLTNLLGQPPAITFNDPKSQSDKIFISWNYPSQKTIGFLNNSSLVPFLETFSLYVNNTNNYVVNNTTSTDFISSTDPVTMIVLYKNSTSTRVETNTSYTVGSTTYNRKAYHIYNSTIVTSINDTSNNILYAWYKNDSTFNSVTQASVNFSKFTGSGAPSQPRNLSVGNPTATSLSVSYTAPEYADEENQGQGIITSYDVSYNSPGSDIRYHGPVVFAKVNKNVAGLTTTLTGLYPDSSFNVQVAATNNSNITGRYTSIVVGRTTNLTPLNPITSITFTYGTYNNSNTTNVYFITSGNTTNSITRSQLSNGSLSVNSLTMPIHRVSNRGKLQTSGTLMTFSANINGSNSQSINFQGFPATTPSNVSNTFITMNNISVVDNYSTSNNFNQGFYLNAVMNMTINNSGFTAGITTNAINFSQSFNTTPVTTSTGSFSFYYDTPITSPPTVSLPSFGINSSFFKQISGINVLHSTTTVTMQSTATNMGNYFYSSPLLNYTCSVNTTTNTFNETNLTNVNSSYYSGNKLASSIVFNSSMNTPNISSAYATQIKLSVRANNLHSSTSYVDTSQNVIIDGPSNTLVYSTLAQNIPTLTTNTAGYRVWSAPTVQNNCPELNYNGIYYKDISYNNAWNITSTNNGGYDATSELLVSNGLFRTPGSGGYINYSTYLNNTFNYSSISATGFRFATFCWKLAGKNPGFYSNLSFTINSISPNPSTNASSLLTINGKQIQVLYFFQDESQTSTFSGSVFNSVWIDGNKNTNLVNKDTFFDTNNNNKYGFYGGNSSVTISGSTATINVFIPPIDPVKNTIYLYLRLAIPMDVNIGFGSVTATIS